MVENPSELAPQAHEAIENMTNDVYVSVLSLWEIAIKSGSGKLKLRTGLQEIIHASEFQFLDVSPADTLTLETLPLHHRDPFDRMLAAQALRHNLILITRDPKFRPYGVPVLEA